MSMLASAARMVRMHMRLLVLWPKQHVLLAHGMLTVTVTVLLPLLERWLLHPAQLCRLIVVPIKRRVVRTARSRLELAL
jgi:hypothetical protein